MPEVKDKTTGQVIAKMPYDTAGKMAAEKMVAENPGYEIKDGAQRSQTMYAGGGETGYNAIGNPMYKGGGKTDEPTSVYGRNRKAAAERRAARQAKRAERRAARQAKRAKRASEKKNIVPRVREKFVYKEGEKGDVSYKKKGPKEQQQVHVTKDGKTTLKSKKTKGGDYAVYGKESKKAKSFRQAFKEAKGADFTWDGRKYSGKTKATKKKSKTVVKKKSKSDIALDKKHKEGWMSTEEGEKPPIKR